MKAIKVLFIALLAIGCVTVADAQMTRKHVVVIKKHPRHRIVLKRKPKIVPHHRPQ